MIEGISTAAPPGVSRAARQFEALFARILLKAMRSSVPQGTLLGAGRAGEIFTDLLDARWADAVARRGLGLARAVERAY